MDHVETHKLATELRTFLENRWPNGESYGRCVESSILVCRVLNETLNPTPRWKTACGDYMARGYDFGSWHCWISNGTHIIDVTADQFEPNPKVLMTVVTDRRYHHTTDSYAEGSEMAANLYREWRSRRDSNTQPSASEADALSG